MKKNGFTLFELLTVLAIILVIAGIALPSFYLMSRGRSLQNAAAMITQTLSAARQMAIARQVYSYADNGFRTIGEKSRCVEFDYTIDPATNEVSNSQIRIFFWVTKKPNIKQYKRVSIGDWEQLPAKIEFYENGEYHYPPEYIKFKSNGAAYTPDSGAPIIFDFAIVDTTTLDDEEGKIKTRVIKVTGITGSIKSEEK